MKNLFEELRRKETPQSSVRWYQDNIRKLGQSRRTSNPQAMFEQNIGQFETTTLIGSMYLFFYDPKTKEKLPYYDRFPLVFPFNITDRGFYGINLHYLSPMLRMLLLNKLLVLADDTSLTDTTRLQLSWDLLKNVQKFPGARPCVKQYLNTHIMSRMLRINPIDWRKTIMLPLDRFEKASNFKVWRDSRKNFNG